MPGDVKTIDPDTAEELFHAKFGDEAGGYEKVLSVFVMQRRWEIVFEVVVNCPADDKVYGFLWFVPATEMQAGLDDMDQPVKLYEVEPEPSVKWRKVKESHG